jgi:phosphoglycerate dehydrogenase-like enzyme
MTPSAWNAGIRVVQAGSVITEAVGETAVVLTLALLHRVNRCDHALRTGRPWAEARALPRRLMVQGTKVGVIGASRTGRAYIRRMLALGADVAVADPYLDAATAKELGVRLLVLDALLRDFGVVSVHAPVNEATKGMLGARELSLLTNGSVLVNTARAALIDEAALLAELRTGRIDAALDVLHEEPLALDSELRALPNVLLSPHIAGSTVDARRAAGHLSVQNITRFLHGEPLNEEITVDMLPHMA